MKRIKRQAIVIKKGGRYGIGTVLPPKKKIDKDIKELVIARLKAIPDDLMVSIG